MTVVVAVSIAMLVIAGVLALLAAIRPGSIADRAVAMDAVVAIIISGLAAGSIRSGDGLFADLALILGLLGFLATVTTARYLGQRRSRP
ncbi:MAG: monovalent cation/H+ antiporter complex subunit F [Ilumatobacteraceae bacterium]